ncbi:MULTISPECIES: hypothetical protein [Saccharibacillus]|uniref:hypothetical protein n=1 Tax=Saccharibacillus TaxID=456492 RepID=UPI0012391B2F|nr:hypothetical protein [Saccharibacillus sp. WB 17]MWJ30424.1 hypothetical protein [Saccharibacillus sp. WB 17]
MNRRILPAVCLVAASLLVLSACGSNNEEEPGRARASAGDAAVTDESREAAAGTKLSREEEEAQILVVLDQGDMPIEIGGLTFGFKRIPEGYALQAMKWQGKGDPVVSTFEEAVEKGRSGGEGFYISGDGQYSGFLYPNTQKGEQGEISFSFANDAGQEISWTKSLTLR